MKIIYDGIEEKGVYIEKYDVGLFLTWKDIKSLEKVRVWKVGKRYAQA